MDVNEEQSDNDKHLQLELSTDPVGRGSLSRDLDHVINVSESDNAVRKRRKRKRDDDDLEGSYMQRLAREEEEEELQRKATRQSEQAAARPIESQIEEETTGTESSDRNGASSYVDEAEDEYVIPEHETVAQNTPSDLEKASRTVFVGNVSTTAILSKSSKRELMNHLSSFFSDLPQSESTVKIESFRFRSTAFASAIPKKAAFARQDLKEATTKSTNAYVVYSTKQAAREAAKRLNGTIVLDRHIRVDEVAHPSKIDHRRCVFVGNLGFVDDETQMKVGDAGNGEKPRKALNGDVEEGLWQQFGKAGTVESVRVVRDAKTRVGKGFAYVQFTASFIRSGIMFSSLILN